MNTEEKYLRNDSDSLTALIADRLGERQRKLELMAEMERTGKSSKRIPMYVVSAIAACIVVLIIVVPLWKGKMSPLDKLGIETPEMTSFRAATPELTEIASLIEQQQYDKALQKTQKVLESSDRDVKGIMELLDGWYDESLMEELEQETLMNTEIRWTYIYLLVKVERYKEARKELKRYLEYGDYCEHREEAKALLKEL